MTLDEAFDQFLNTRLAEIFGPRYKEIRDVINKEIIVKIKEHTQRINELEETIKSFSGNINIISKNNEKHSQEIVGVQLLSKENRGLVVGINNKNKELSQTIERLEKELKYLTGEINAVTGKNRELERKIVDLELKNKSLASRGNGTDTGSLPLNFERSEKTPQTVQTADRIVIQFNNWAANPIVPIPRGFTFLEGNFKILTKQPLIKTTVETNWITNENGEKKYLFPNPNSFNQMTDIRELYDMNQNMLKEKGKNKIEIITPCEISASGWIEFAGKLRILP
jgi:uncharacterized protein YoxC